MADWKQVVFSYTVVDRHANSTLNTLIKNADAKRADEREFYGDVRAPQQIEAAAPLTLVQRLMKVAGAVQVFVQVVTNSVVENGRRARQSSSITSPQTPV